MLAFLTARCSALIVACAWFSLGAAIRRESLPIPSWPLVLSVPGPGSSNGSEASALHAFQAGNLENLVDSSDLRLAKLLSTNIGGSTSSGSRSTPDLKSLGLDDERVKVFSKHLAEMQPTVEFVRFENNSRLSTDGWADLLLPLTLAGSKLREVDFGDCDLDDDSASLIGEQVSCMAPKVKKLKFGGNRRLSVEAWKALLTPLTMSSSILEEIDLNNCDLDLESAQAIGRALVNLAPSVRKLDLHGNGMLSSRSWESLLKSMATFEPGFEASFSSCALSDDSAKLIGEQLASMKSEMKRIDLGGNRKLSPLGWASLLMPLRVGSPGIQVLCLDGNDLDDTLAKFIGQKLSSLGPRLLKLDLGGNRKLSPIGWGSLFDAMTPLNGVGFHEVGFHNCDLDDQCADSIRKILPKKATTVRRVNFQGNKLEPLAWEALLPVLTLRDTSLEEVNLADCELNNQSARDVGFAMLSIHRTRKKIDFSGRTVGRVDLIELTNEPDA